MRDFTRKVATEACADHLSLILYDTPACAARPQELPTCRSTTLPILLPIADTERGDRWV